MAKKKTAPAKKTAAVAADAAPKAQSVADDAAPSQRVADPDGFQEYPLTLYRECAKTEKTPNGYEARQCANPEQRSQFGKNWKTEPPAAASEPL